MQKVVWHRNNRCLVLPEFNRRGTREGQIPVPQQKEHHDARQSNIEDEQEIQVLIVRLLHKRKLLKI